MSSDELLKKWKKVLDYRDDITPELSEFERLYLATLFENWERHFLESEDTELLKIIVPQMRRNKGQMETVEIENRLWDIVNIKNIDGDWTKYAINTDDVIIEKGNHSAYRETFLSNCWEMKNGDWEWKPY